MFGSGKACCSRTVSFLMHILFKPSAEMLRIEDFLDWRIRLPNGAIEGLLLSGNACCVMMRNRNDTTKPTEKQISPSPPVLQNSNARPWSLHQTCRCMCTIAAHQHNIWQKRIPIVSFFGTFPIAFHDVGCQELGRVAVSCKHVNSASQMLEQIAIEASLLLQRNSKTRCLKEICAENAHGLCRCSDNVFSTTALHSHTAQGATANVHVVAAASETNEQLSLSLVANETKSSGFAELLTPNAQQRF